jgi:hypothetical protein
MNSDRIPKELQDINSDDDVQKDLGKDVKIPFCNTHKMPSGPKYCEG